MKRFRFYLRIKGPVLLGSAGLTHCPLPAGADLILILSAELNCFIAEPLRQPPGNKKLPRRVPETATLTFPLIRSPLAPIKPPSDGLLLIFLFAISIIS